MFSGRLKNENGVFLPPPPLPRIPVRSFSLSFPFRLFLFALAPRVLFPRAISCPANPRFSGWTGFGKKKGKKGVGHLIFVDREGGGFKLRATGCGKIKACPVIDQNGEGKCHYYYFNAKNFFWRKSAFLCFSFLFFPYFFFFEII